MWCKNCQHGHVPNEKGLCPCCGVDLDKHPIVNNVDSTESSQKSVGVTIESIQTSSPEVSAYYYGETTEKQPKSLRDSEEKRKTRRRKRRRKNKDTGSSTIEPGVSG